MTTTLVARYSKLSLGFPLLLWTFLYHRINNSNLLGTVYFAVVLKYTVFLIFLAAWYITLSPLHRQRVSLAQNRGCLDIRKKALIVSRVCFHLA